ncbi:hypothetical protein [Paenibacillus sp. FSL W8-0194]|uniref:hypothetical protein n=1 Tax=Paenibacillus sp. FSL W8-0194 TaxID=2921711 RepID=UPI0030DD07B7
MGQKNRLSGVGGNGYQFSTYIQGDFNKSYFAATNMVNTYESLKELDGKNPQYNLITCSCFTNSKELLSIGTLYNGVSMEKFMATVTSKELEFAGIAGTKVPNVGNAAFAMTFYNDAFTKDDYAQQLSSEMERYENMNWFMKTAHRANYHIFRLNILFGQNP